MSAQWESTRRILNRFAAHCEPVRFAPPWDRLRCRKQTLCALSNAERIVASLREEWDEADLIQSGLLRRRNGEVAIARRLINQGPQIVLRAAQRQRPYEIVGGRGNLTYRGLPLLDSLDDYQIREHLKASERLLLVATEIWDAAILRALGMPASTAAGLSGASLSQLEEMSNRFGWRTDMPDRGSDSSSEDRLRLVLVGWNVRSMELIAPAGLSELARELLSVEQSLQYDLQDVGIWIPIESDLKRARFFLDRNEFCHVRDTFILSIHDTCRSLTGMADGGSELTDVVDALREIRKASEDGQSLYTPHEAQKIYEAAVNRELVEPMLDYALATADPYRRNLTVMAADISRMFFQLMPDTLASSGDNSAQFERRLRTQLELSGRFVAIMNALKQKKK
ncbi:MAG: hypothetical protein H6822_08430 [Planctomycetaceae bacterium]|nr:hypothetical protein [Planctomycetales bacterium]MCB9922195.1 hypothetical protein [Planctomycetaceae bacterium]